MREDNCARGVHDNLYCNVILMESNGEIVCFLGMDLLGLQYNQCHYIKAKIEEMTGLSFKNIVITATHTHSGPDVIDIFKDRIDQKCIEYIEKIAEKISMEIKLLLQRLEKVTISLAKKLVYDLSFNRRLIMRTGSMRMNWENVDIEGVDTEAGPIDPELYVITVYGSDEKIKAIMVNFTLHPAVLVGKDWLWSRDYINYLDNYIKHVLANDVVVFFANGAEGNINHINFRDKNQRRGFEEAKRIGEILGKHVLECLDNDRMIEDQTLKCITETIRLPLRIIPEGDIKKAEELLLERGDKIPSLLDGVPDEIYAREIIKLSKIEERYVETEIQAVKIGDMVIATVPGEVFVEIGLKIKQLSTYQDTLVFGLTNDYVGYIPTQVAFREGGYEIKTAASSKLDDIAGEQLVNEVIALLKKLKFRN